MASRKQQIYCRLLYRGLIFLRSICGQATHLTAEELLRSQRTFEVGWQHANFLHHVHVSILEPDYVENDIGFINFAFPCHVERLGDMLSPETTALMLEFYEGVPESLRPQLTWHPSEEFRRLAGRGAS